VVGFGPHFGSDRESYIVHVILLPSKFSPHSSIYARRFCYLRRTPLIRRRDDAVTAQFSSMMTATRRAWSEGLRVRPVGWKLIYACEYGRRSEPRTWKRAETGRAT